MKITIAIIGWWAAGMMVAATLAQKKLENDRDGQILLFEKNKSLGAKVIISGGGRCNLTTWYTKRSQLQSKYTRGWEFFEVSLKMFTPRSVKKRFETNWVPCKIEEDMRVFPVSNDGKDVVKMFEDILQTWWVELHYKEPILDIRKCDEVFVLTSADGSYTVDKVVLTTGGNAFAHTGSTGDGYAFARSLGHTITPLGPSLNSFVTQQEWIHALSGLSFPDAALHMTLSRSQDLYGHTAVCPEIDKTPSSKPRYEKQKHTWPILLTHFGISGPLTFVAASESAFETVTSDSPLETRLQPLAEMSYEHRDQFLLDTSKSSKKELATTLATRLPRRFAEALLDELDIRSHMPISQLSKKDRNQLSDRLGHGIPLSLIQRRPGDEFVTAGGVDTREIDPDTLESTICSGLYFAWEILNTDGVTWWYNLQMCWSTGRSVGMGI